MLIYLGVGTREAYKVGRWAVEFAEIPVEQPVAESRLSPRRWWGSGACVQCCLFNGCRRVLMSKREGEAMTFCWIAFPRNFCDIFCSHCFPFLFSFLWWHVLPSIRLILVCSKRVSSFMRLRVFVGSRPVLSLSAAISLNGFFLFRAQN